MLLNTALAAGPSIGRSAVMARSADAPHEDCLECRMIGTGAMLGISGYFVYLSRGLKSSTRRQPTIQRGDERLLCDGRRVPMVHVRAYGACCLLRCDCILLTSQW